MEATSLQVLCLKKVDANTDVPPNNLRTKDCENMAKLLDK